MKVKKDRNVFALEMKSELDLLNYGGHDYLLSASALPLEEQLFQPHFSILGKKYHRQSEFIVNQLSLCMYLQIVLKVQANKQIKKSQISSWTSFLKSHEFSLVRRESYLKLSQHEPIFHSLYQTTVQKKSRSAWIDNKFSTISTNKLVS